MGLDGFANPERLDLSASFHSRNGNECTARPDKLLPRLAAFFSFLQRPDLSPVEQSLAKPFFGSARSTTSPHNGNNLSLWGCEEYLKRLSKAAGIVSKIIRKDKGGYEITITDASDGRQVVDIIPPGPELLVSGGLVAAPATEKVAPENIQKKRSRAGSGFPDREEG
ncbi:hypothetical protein KY290_025755 [Solanum tuberosum]|uniref:Cytochrome f n=1 Tax=Solanum tuberosum TaxID=4113 RepID=A0ABQ7UXJ9_SOLTU|nr:hypothetical protein KY285_024594 [Solanum tuberosum]KAH0755485.1 hypothetical protein KY290_025755 [Solanum tuberosum]